MGQVGLPHSASALVPLWLREQLDLMGHEWGLENYDVTGIEGARHTRTEGREDDFALTV